MKYRGLIVIIFMSLAAAGFAEEIGHGSSVYRARNVHAGNLVRVTFQNHCMMGTQSGDQSVSYAGEWPIGTGQVQMGNSSPYVMTEMRIPAGTDSVTGDTTYTWVTPVIFCEGWNPNVFSHDSLGTFLGFEPLPGYYSIAQREKDPFHAVAMSHQAYTWPPFWPDKQEDSNDPGWSASWNGYFGKDQLNADEESYFVMDDYQFKKRLQGHALPKPLLSESDRGGLGLRMAVRGLQWSNPDAEDCIFWLYEIRNFGELNLEKTLFGTNVGASSGALLGENTDYADDVASFYREKALAVNFDYDNLGTRGYTPVPWVGFAFLESPGNPFDGVDNDGDAAEFGGGRIINNEDFLKFYSAGDDVVLIDYDSDNYERTVTTMPAEGIRFTHNGITYTKKPNAPLEEVPRNLIDDNLNGMIDESDGAMTQDSLEYYLYIRSELNDQDYLGVDYVTGEGLDNPMIDERRDDGIDNDRDWNPDFDDVGLDGKPGTGDTGEGDHTATAGFGNLPGEPNIDQVDVDESDQIGLTSFKFYQYGEVTYSNDDQMWDLSRPGFFDTQSTVVGDHDYLFSCGYFPLFPQQEEFISVAMVYGLDETDILRNKEVIQRIYNSNYNFAIAPVKPTLRAVAGNQKVTLYWDDAAEYSYDRYLREFDFEGYKIYRASHHTFEDAGLITDGLGYERFKVPMATYDKTDSLFGYFPDDFGTGVLFNMGNETGLVHAYVDSPVTNGIRYYYAVTAYDRGNLDKNIGPTENTIYLNVDQSGNIQFAQNVAAVIPEAPALGYEGPGFDAEPQPVGEGITTGRVGVRFLDPDSLVDGQEYEIQFLDQSMDMIDNDFDWQAFTDENFNGAWDQGEPLNDDLGADGLGPGDPDYPGPDTGEANGKPTTGEPNFDGLDPDEFLPVLTTGFVLKNITQNTVVDTIPFWTYRSLNDSTRIQLQNLYEDRDGDPRTLTKILEHMEIYVYNPPPGVINMPELNVFNGVQWSRNILYATAYDLRFSPFSLGGFKTGISYPRQYEIVFYDEIVQKSVQLGVPLASTGTPYPLPAADVNYRIFDPQTGEELQFGVVDASVDPNLTPPGFFSAKDRIIFFEDLPNGQRQITFNLLNNEVQDTSFYNIYGRILGAGDTLRLVPDFPFTGNIRYRFQVRGQIINAGTAKNNLDRIRVVPNPYVVTALWEPHNPYTTGRGPRKIEFIHLPPKCTIRIYAVDGTLVQTLEHESSLTNGAEPWDMMTRENMDISYGIYLYHVDAPGIGEHVGRFLVIK
ncbi:hypothetical protein JW948_14465 [bacterium]|nr:hypothetical protein [bacterium]